MARQGQVEILPMDTQAVIAHPDQLDATLLQVDLYARGAGIQAVLHQLLDH